MTMRILRVLFLFAPFLGTVCAQDAAPPRAVALDLDQSVEAFVFGPGFDLREAKHFKRAGDAVAVALGKVVSDRDVNDGEIESAVAALSTAFSDTNWIEDPSNREPRMALFVLRYLYLCTQDQELKSKIAETRRRLKELMVKTNSSGH